MKGIADEVDELRGPTIDQIIDKVAEDRWVKNKTHWCQRVSGKLQLVKIDTVSDFLRKAHSYNNEIRRKNQQPLYITAMDSFMSVIAK